MLILLYCVVFFLIQVFDFFLMQKCRNSRKNRKVKCGYDRHLFPPCLLSPMLARLRRRNSRQLIHAGMQSLMNFIGKTNDRMTLKPEDLPVSPHCLLCVDYRYHINKRTYCNCFICTTTHSQRHLRQQMNGDSLSSAILSAFSFSCHRHWQVALFYGILSP